MRRFVTAPHPHPLKNPSKALDFYETLPQKLNSNSINEHVTLDVLTFSWYTRYGLSNEFTWKLTDLGWINTWIGKSDFTLISLILRAQRNVQLSLPLMVSQLRTRTVAAVTTAGAEPLIETDQSQVTYATWVLELIILRQNWPSLLPALNPFTPKISLTILRTVYHAILMMLVWRIWY